MNAVLQYCTVILFGLDQINDDNYIYSIARYYYVHYWDRNIDGKPLLVGFKAKDYL